MYIIRLVPAAAGLAAMIAFGPTVRAATTDMPFPVRVIFEDAMGHAKEGLTAAQMTRLTTGACVSFHVPDTAVEELIENHADSPVEHYPGSSCTSPPDRQVKTGQIAEIDYPNSNARKMRNHVLNAIKIVCNMCRTR